MTRPLRTHCPEGHPLSGDNLYEHGGRRHCKECRRRQLRESRVRRAPAVKNTGGVTPTSWRERFWRYVTPGAPDDCWEWQGSRNSHGYGRINSGGRHGRTLKAHRASYEIHHGVDPGELDVCHRCDNPPCVNPAHLFLGDAKANAQDMSAKGRHGNYLGKNAKLTDERVRALRERFAAGEDSHALATDFEIARNYVYIVASGSARANSGGPLTRRRP